MPTSHLLQQSSVFLIRTDQANAQCREMGEAPRQVLRAHRAFRSANGRVGDAFDVVDAPASRSRAPPTRAGIAAGRSRRARYPSWAARQAALRRVDTSLPRRALSGKSAGTAPAADQALAHGARSSSRSSYANSGDIHVGCDSLTSRARLACRWSRAWDRRKRSTARLLTTRGTNVRNSAGSTRHWPP